MREYLVIDTTDVFNYRVVVTEGSYADAFDSAMAYRDTFNRKVAIQEVSYKEVV